MYRLLRNPECWAVSAVSQSCARVPVWVTQEASDAVLCKKAQRKQGRLFSFLSQNTFPFKSGGDLSFALTFVNEIEQMQTDLILPSSSPFTSPA